MEVEHFAQQLHQKLAEKVEDNSTYRKAEGVLQSLIHAGQTIPNFNITIGGNTKTMALYLTAGTFKLLKKTIEGNSRHQHQLDSYLLLLSHTLPETSPQALVQAGLLKQLRRYMQIILARKDNSPLMTRLTASILSHAFAPQMATANFKVGEDRELLLDLFERSVASPRSNALSRECSRLLTHLMKNNQSVSATISEYAKANLLSSLQERKEIYLSNVKEVMVELPVRLLNDICHRVASNLEQIDAADPTQELYLSQTYAFLEKMSPKLLASTLEDMVIVLINLVPGGAMSDKVQLSYLQLLYETTVALVHINEQACNRILSPVISVLIQLLLINSKISKFANNQLVFVIQNCIRPSLWRKQNQQLSLEGIKLEDESRSFTKIVCLFQGMLSSRFSNYKITVSLLSSFFSQLEEDALGQCLSLIHKVIQYRAELGEKGFKRVMESVILSFGIQKLLNLYPLSIEGDIAQQSFEEQNNLWLLNCIQKTERAQKMYVFNGYMLPLLQKVRMLRENPSLSKQRRQGYGLVEELIWRCLKPFSKIIDNNANYEQVMLLIESELKRVSQTTLQQLSLALQQLANALAPIKYQSKAAEQLIKTLATILNIANGSAKAILSAIKGLSRIAPADYVKRVFDKNIQKMIGQAEEGSLTKEEDKNLKNLQILMAVNSSIDLCSPEVATKYRQSREQLLLRLASLLIKCSGAFQKKGYKYINETLSAAPRSLYLQILELFESDIKVQNGAKHHRLSVLTRVWQWLKSGDIQENLQKMITFIKNHLPELLLTLREQNKGAREDGAHLIGQFTDTMQQLGLLQNFIETVCAGLVGERSQMKLATLHGLSIIIGKGSLNQQIFKEVLEIVLLLLHQKKQQLYRGVVEFCKKGILSLPLDRQKVYLPNVLQLLFEQDQEGKLEHRSILRHFLIRLSKKHGKELIEAMIPQSHRKMLSHALKMQNRQKRKKRELNLARMQQRRQQSKRKSNEESSDEDESEGYQPQVRGEQMDIQQPLDELDNENNLLLKYDLDKEQFHFQKEQRGAAPLHKKIEKSPDEITFDDKGIMIIEERKRTKNTMEDEEAEPQNKAAEQPINFKKKSKVQIHQVKESGETYRTNRAGGDLKLKDKPEPYAFIQFSSKALNKRFKKRAEQVFDNLFQKKQGGLRGLKKRLIGGH